MLILSSGAEFINFSLATPLDKTYPCAFSVFDRDGNPELGAKPMTITLAAIEAEAREISLDASEEHPGVIHITDGAGRFIIIGQLASDGDEWRADVYPNRAAVEAGDQPSESDELTGDNVRVLVAHALQIANRVPVVTSSKAPAADLPRFVVEGVTAPATDPRREYVYVGTFDATDADEAAMMAERAEAGKRSFHHFNARRLYGPKDPAARRQADRDEDRARNRR